MRALLLGLVVALLGVGHPYGSPLRPPLAPGEVAWWVADRDGDALWALDAELLPVHRTVLVAPVAVVRAGEEVWVASAPARDPAGRRSLRRVTLEGLGRAHDLPPLLDLAGTTRGVAALTREGELLWVDGAGVRSAGRVPRGRLPRRGALLGEGAEVWVAAGEEVWRVDRAGTVLGRQAVGFEVQGLTRDEGGLWLLDPQGRARRPDGEVGPALGGEVTLAAGWALDRRSSRLVRLHDGWEGVIRSPLAGLEAAAQAADGDLLVVAAGSLHLCDGSGRRRVAQGGFGFAVSAAPAAGSGPR